MKKSISFLLALCVLCSLFACGNETSESNGSPDVEQSASVEQTDPVEQTAPVESLYEIPQETNSVNPDELHESEPAETAVLTASPDSEDDIPPIGPVGGEGISSLDVTISLLSNTTGGDVVYDPEANCIIVMVSADGIVQGFISAYADDSAAATERWKETRSTYQSFDASTRKLINITCDSKVDTMFAVFDNEQEYKYVMLFQNGEVTHSLIDDFINQQLSVDE